MNSTMHRTPKSGRQSSLFFQDLASPISTRRSGSKFSTPGQAAAVSALCRENFAISDLPPPPVFTLEDRSDFSSESPVSPEIRSYPRTPVQSSGKDFSTPSEASTPYAFIDKYQQQNRQSPVGSLSFWSPAKGGGIEHDDKGKGSGSPVQGVVQPGSLITLPLPREVARPEMQKNPMPVGKLDEEEWITVYGFSLGDTNLVLREFEKCGVILKHVPGPRDANWMHILYQSRYDAQRALGKNGMHINGVLIVGVKPVDPVQLQALNEKLNNQGFIPLLPAASSKSAELNPFKPLSHPYHLQNGNNVARQSSGSIATPAKSLVSKATDWVFGF